MKDVASPNVVRTTHGHATREMTFQALQALGGHGDPGKFGRMFPMLSGLDVGDDALFDLALAMNDADPRSPDGENPDVPAGYTYLAQFVDHDITLDLTPLDQQENDPLATQNFRSPALDLDSVYGPGPALAPFMYQRDANGGTIPKLLIGMATQSGDFAGGPDIPALPNDLPRNRVGRAIIGDERNDENLLVAQTHLAFLKFHNAVYDFVADRMTEASQDEIFAEAKRLTRWHYQWIVLFDFVERITEPGLVAQIKHDGRRFYRFKTRPYIPAEFSGAAYRLGHSMIRERYDHNRVFLAGSAFPATLGALFDFTGKSGMILGDDAAGSGKTSLSGVPPQETLPSNWVIDWRRFFEVAGSDQVGVNPSRKLDPFLTPALSTLPGEVDRNALLAFRNLKRGVQLGLPSGQDVASIMGLPVMSPDDIASGPDGAAAAAHDLHYRTPLWYYILKESKVHHDGTRLGPVGSTIIAETFLGLVHGDHDSFMWQRSDWQPELPSAQPGTFTMADLLAFVDDINPVG